MSILGKIPPDLPVDPDAGVGRPSQSIFERLDVYAAVAVGGAVGSLARYGVAQAMPTVTNGFPTSTLLVNLVGSFVLGVVLVVLVERLPPSRYVRAFLAVGVLGAFTTFSSFVVATVQLMQHHHPGTAAAYVVLSVVAGLAVAWAGILVGRTIPHPRLAQAANR